jgi:cell wall-associated NlpC family hydrolase
MSTRRFVLYSLVISMVLHFISTDRPQKTETKPVADRHTPLKIGTGVVYLFPTKKTYGPYRIKLPAGPHMSESAGDPVLIATKLLTEQAVATTAEIITEAPTPLPDSNPSPSPVTAAQSASGAVEGVVGFALAQLGEPYVWGATGPNSWDCSGLVQAAFRSVGIITSRTTKTLINEGSSVSRANMVRGDIVFTSSGHVGIYLGNNEMVHAPQTGDVVKISTLWSFYAARRLM